VGSIVREDFNKNSDIDLLVSYLPSVSIGLLDMVELKEKMEDLFGRSIDLMSKKAIENGKNKLKKEIVLGLAIIMALPTSRCKMFSCVTNSERWVTARQVNSGLKSINYCPRLTHPTNNKILLSPQVRESLNSELY
jgi:predicted nucleotidyltransferase